VSSCRCHGIQRCIKVELETSLLDVYISCGEVDKHDLTEAEWSTTVVCQELPSLSVMRDGIHGSILYQRSIKRRVEYRYVVIQLTAVGVNRGIALPRVGQLSVIGIVCQIFVQEDITEKHVKDRQSILVLIFHHVHHLLATLKQRDNWTKVALLS
jgi:hypothetical protein